MKGLVLTVAIIGILAVVVTTRSRNAPPSSSPAPTAIEDQIAFRDQAGLELRMRSQIEAMRQLAAMDNPAAATPVLEANTVLRQDQERITAQHRQGGGDLPPPKDWDEFLRLDAALRAAPR